MTPRSAHDVASRKNGRGGEKSHVFCFRRDLVLVCARGESGSPIVSEFSFSVFPPSRLSHVSSASSVKRWNSVLVALLALY